MAAGSSKTTWALRLAALAVGATSAKGRTWLVRRLDAQEPYLLVAGTTNNQQTIAAAIGSSSGQLLSLVRNQILSVHQPAALAHAERGASISLVWMPCTASFSPLYPFWQVQHGAHIFYVDQQGKVWDKLTEGKG